jgi:Multiubiquitin
MGQNFNEENQNAGEGHEQVVTNTSTDHQDGHETIYVELIVNGRERSWDKKKISYEEIIEIAFGKEPKHQDLIYTVTYLHGPKENPDGTLTKGKSVFVKNKMIFNAKPTVKS